MVVRSSVVSVKLGVVLGLALAACSSSSSPSSSTDPTEPTPSSSAKKPDTTATPPPPPPPADQPKTGDAACGAESTNQACQECCIQNHQSGYQTYLGAMLACACGTGDAGAGVCATECKDTACKNPPAQPDAACNTCLQNALSSQSSACAQPVSTACQSDKDCTALATCAQPCSKKK